MNDIKMTDLTECLKELGHQAIFINSGGGCGTIYIGEPDAEGFYEYAVGPSSYAMNLGTIGEMCVGVDGSSNATYLEGIDPITPMNVARTIHTIIKKETN